MNKDVKAWQWLNENELSYKIWDNKYSSKRRCKNSRIDLSKEIYIWR